MRRVGWFLLVMGVSLAAVWAALLVTGQVPELEEGRIDIWFHLAAELLTSVALVAAAVLMLRRTPRAPLMAGVALGALAYTAVNSAGYYAQAGDWVSVGMFGLIAASTALAGAWLLGSSRPGDGAGTEREGGGSAGTAVTPAGHGATTPVDHGAPTRGGGP